jgi:DNA-binding beta-propeller fold protein YncE
MKNTMTIYGIVLAPVCGLAMAITLKAQDMYVANGNNNTIGAYGLDGSTVDARLVSSGLDDPTGIAVSGNDLFVANFLNNTIGEYTTSGQTVNA